MFPMELVFALPVVVTLVMRRLRTLLPLPLTMPLPLLVQPQLQGIPLAQNPLRLNLPVPVLMELPESVAPALVLSPKLPRPQLTLALTTEMITFLFPSPRPR